MCNIKELILEMAKLNASDLHLQVGEIPFIRIEGELKRLESTKPIKKASIESFLATELLAEHSERFEKHGHLDFAYQAADGIRVRGTLYHQRGLPGASFRLIPPEIPSIKALGLPDIVEEISRIQYGLVLVCGPTGSGKSTTLASMIDHINIERSAHVITIEDPAEFGYENRKCLIQQREIGIDTDDFPSGLREALRQDPDVILVGEMRDLESISMALLAAETGHLVLSSLHTSGAANTIIRIIEAYPIGQQQEVRTQLAITLRAVISQILVPRADGAGRAPAVEVMMVDTAVRNLIRENKVHQILSQLTTGKMKGNISLEQSLKSLIDKEIIDPSTGIEFAHDPATLTGLFG